MFALIDESERFPSYCYVTMFYFIVIYESSGVVNSFAARPSGFLPQAENPFPADTLVNAMQAQADEAAAAANIADPIPNTSPLIVPGSGLDNPLEHYQVRLDRLPGTFQPGVYECCRSVIRRL